MDRQSIDALVADWKGIKPPQDDPEAAASFTDDLISFERVIRVSDQTQKIMTILNVNPPIKNVAEAIVRRYETAGSPDAKRAWEDLALVVAEHLSTN